MYFHIFGFRWKPEATEAQKSRATVEILAFRGVIPGLLEAHVGHNESPRGQGYTFAGVMRFAGKQACEDYTTHPKHLALLSWLTPLIEPVELDFVSM